MIRSSCEYESIDIYLYLPFRFCKKNLIQRSFSWNNGYYTKRKDYYLVKLKETLCF